jgi:hypothetical protein
LLAVSQETEGDFRCHERVHGDTSDLEQALQIRIVCAEVVDPNGGVGKNHDLFEAPLRDVFQFGHGSTQCGEAARGLQVD